MSKIVIKQKRNINSTEFNSIEEYETSPAIHYYINEYEFNVSIDYFAYFFRKIYKCKNVPDIAKSMIDTIDDKAICELCTILSIDSSNLICMNNLFDWDDIIYDVPKLIEKLELKVKKKNVFVSYALSYVLDELVKSYNTFSLKKKIITADLIINESDIFSEFNESELSKRVRCQTLIENENIFCNVIQQRNDTKRYIFLKDMEINPSKDTENAAPYLIEFVVKSQFMFDIYFSNPYSNKGGFVDIFVVIPSDNDQEYYQIFLNSSNTNPFLEIRKTSLLVDSILQNKSDAFGFNVQEFYVGNEEMTTLKSSYNKEYHKYLDISVWESISKDSCIKDVFEFSKFLEQFLVGLNATKLDRNTNSNWLSIRREKNNFTFKWKANETDELINFFQLNFKNGKNLQFDLYESAWYYAPILLNRLKFMNQMQSIEVKGGKIDLIDLNLMNFETLHKDSSNDDFSNLYKTNRNRLLDSSEEKRLKLIHELQDILIPDVNFQRNCPDRTELQLLHFGLLGDFKEVIKYIFPVLNNLEIMNTTLNNYDTKEIKLLATSIGSNHYLKVNPPNEIKVIDRIFVALCNQVDTNIEQESSVYDKNYVEIIRNLRTKNITAKNMYDEFTILIDTLYYISTSDKKTQFNTPLNNKRKRDENEQLSSNKRPRGRPPKEKKTKET